MCCPFFTDWTPFRIAFNTSGGSVTNYFWRQTHHEELASVGDTAKLGAVGMTALLGADNHMFCFAGN